MNTAEILAASLWPEDQRDRFKRMIVITLIVKQRGPLTSESMFRLLNDGYGYTATRSDVFRDVNTLDWIGLVEMIDGKLVFAGEQFWPFDF